MATAVITARLTVEEFYNSPEIPDNAELVHGEVRLVAPGARSHSWVSRTIFLALYAYAAPRGLGKVFQDATGYALPPRDHTVRIPDVSFVRAGRLPTLVPRRGPMRLAPDLAVEVLSDSDTHVYMRKTLADYFDAGVSLVWLVDLDGRGVEVHAPGAAPRWVAADGVLDGGDVLPALALPVRDLFAGVAAD